MKNGVKVLAGSLKRTGKPAVFVGARDVSVTGEPAIVVSKCLDELVEMSRETYGAKPSTICIDNAANMQRGSSSFCLGRQ